MSKWKKIEHRLICKITQNWRGKPLVRPEVIVNLITNTTTARGLKVKAVLDTSSYPCGTKVSKTEAERLRLQPATILGDGTTQSGQLERHNDHVISERLLTDQVTGLLCDATDLAQKIAKLLDDPGLRRQMGLAGRKRFEQDFQWETVIDRYWRLLLTPRNRASSRVARRTSDRARIASR
jgi:Rhodopirellula transposase DDE domain/Glycosyl transferases group 1